MGERAAYKASEKGKSLFMIRKQWYEGSTHKELSELVGTIAGNLMIERFCIPGQKPSTIGDGMIALRDDLGIGRLSMALLMAVSSPPFDEVVEDGDLNCDINDHGIYEIELVKWNEWNINQYPVHWDKEKRDQLGKKRHLATVTFEKGKTLEKGMKIIFHVPNDWEYPGK